MLKDLILKNRSYRGFDNNIKITRQKLEEYIHLCSLTASSANKQPLKYYLASEQKQIEDILSKTKWAAALPKLELPKKGQGPTAFVIICQDLSIAPNETVYLKDVGIVAQTLLLCAVEDGFGGCMIGNFKADEISSLLELPDNIKPKLIVALGKPIEKIILTDVKDNNTAYYRDENGTHYVPKRNYKEEIINR